jgi:hypothetical protein
MFVNSTPKTTISADSRRKAETVDSVPSSPALSAVSSLSSYVAAADDDEPAPLPAAPDRAPLDERGHLSLVDNAVIVNGFDMKDGNVLLLVSLWLAA